MQQAVYNLYVKLIFPKRVLPVCGGIALKKENQRVKLTKRLLKDALISLLKEKDFENINISELCRVAGINRATFYKHYTTPHDIVIDMENDIMSTVQKPTGPLNTESMQEYLENTCICLQNNAETLKLLVRCNNDADFNLLLDDFFKALWNLRHSISAMKDIDAESLRLASSFIASGMYCLLRQWIIEEIDKTPKEVAALIFGLINKHA